jgi:hypothetical protein
MSVKKFLFLLHFRANDRLKMGGGLLAAAMGQNADMSCAQIFS